MIAVLHRCTSAFFLLGIAPEKMAEAIANDGKTPFQINIPIDGFGISRGPLPPSALTVGGQLCTRACCGGVCAPSVPSLAHVALPCWNARATKSECSKHSPELRVLCVLCGAKLECSGGGW